MNEPVTVVIPVQRGTEWNQPRATSLPAGTPYVVVEHDEGEWADALNNGVQHVQTPLVFLSAQDAWIETQPDALDFLSGLAWDCDVTYGQLLQWENGEPRAVIAGEMFCPNRLRRKNYLPPLACIRREKFLGVGGVRTGMWDLWVRMLDAGARFKYVPEAYTARDDTYQDPSVVPASGPLEATFYYQSTPGTAYWRCLLPARHLPGQAVFNVPRFHKKGSKIIFPDHWGAAIMQYAGDEAHHELTLAFQREGYRALIEVDDTYVHWFPRVMPKAGWVKHKEKDKFSVEQHVETCRVADGVVVTTERLAKQYRPLNENVYICPNQIDPADWPDPVKPDDGVFRVGWFSSGSHRDDMKLIRRALEWCSRQPGVEVMLIGLGVSNGKPWYPFRFRHVPWSNDFGVYRKFLMQLDVGLAPVVGTPWALCRSDLKALEYAMAQALPVVSDVPPYEGLEVPGVIHCPDAKAFLRAVQWAVANKDEVRQLAKEARDYVRHERTVEKNIDKWKAAICKA